MVGLHAHSSHILQPLDVSVFLPSKSYLQKELHRSASHENCINAFDVGIVIRNAYAISLIPKNIQQGFINSGTWDPLHLTTNPEAVESICFHNSATKNSGNGDD